MHRKRLHILPTRAVVILTVITITVMALSISFLLWDLRKRELAHSRQETISLTQMFMAQTQQNIDNLDLVLKGVQERLETRYGRQQALDSLPTRLLLGSRMAGMQEVTALFLVDHQGFVVNSTRELNKPIAVADRAYFKEFASKHNSGLFIEKPERSRIDGQWTIFLARPLTHANGTFKGVVVAAVSVQKLGQRYNILKLDFERPISIYMLDGTLLASLPHREGLIGSVAPEMAGKRLGHVHGVSFGTQLRGDGTPQTLVVGRVDQYPLLVSVTNDEEETLASWRETAIPIGMGAALVCLLISAACMVLVTELKKEEALSLSLRDANDRYHRTIDSVMDAIVAVDESQNILFFNPAAEKMFGYTAKDVIGKPLEHLIPHALRNVHRHHVQRYTWSNEGARSMGPQLDIAGLRADGREFPIESTVSQMVIDGKRQFTAVLRDVTERRRAEADLREMNRQLRALSTALQDVREQERTRISRELHDDLGQQLTGLKLDLSWLSNRLKDGRELPADVMDNMRRQMDDAIASVRRISTELRPLILDDLGFGEAVVWQANEVAKRSGLDIRLKLDAAPWVQQGELATALFRIVQESLTNCVRHAQATHVDIELSVDEKFLLLTVSDNGRGFVMNDQRAGGIGLVSMRERIEALGGVLNIYSSPGQGTRVQAKLLRSSPLLVGETT